VSHDRKARIRRTAKAAWQAWRGEDAALLLLSERVRQLERAEFERMCRRYRDRLERRYWRQRSYERESREDYLPIIAKDW
jgi:hypothetical protein